VVHGVASSPGGGAAMFEIETLGVRSKLIPRSPRMYQLEPTSKVAGPWLAGMDGGGAVPSRSAASAGEAAAVSPAQAREKRTFIGNPRIAAAARTGATLQGRLEDNT